VKPLAIDLYCGRYARIERYGATSVIELIVADISVRSFDIMDKARANHLARTINERLAGLLLGAEIARRSE
jgi:hypothetical protein